MSNNELYTPACYIDAARDVMGGIDLDPASCAYANQVVRAPRYYTQAENGLAQEWYGRVWLNPPYSRGAVKPFVNKLMADYRGGQVEQAIVLLLGNSCFNCYFDQLWSYPLCFKRGALHFYSEQKAAHRFGFGSIFVYLGARRERFREIFAAFGAIVERVA